VSHPSSESPEPEGHPSQGPIDLPHSRTEPWVARFPATFGLIAFTMFVFLTQWFAADILMRDWVLEYGAKIREAIAAGEVWRLITPIFVHVDIWHFFINMYSLYVLGPAVENFFSSSRMLAFYLIAGVSGVGLSLLLSPHGSAGASGAIFGLLGALLAFFFRHRKVFGRRGMLQFRNLIFVALLNLFIGLMPGIDSWGHVGGFIAGIVLSYFLGPEIEPQWLAPERPRLVDHRPWRDTRRWILLSGALILALSMMASFSTLGR
jgi:membrane associated rhomboid family serine protease